jgi:hypothetical protein
MPTKSEYINRVLLIMNEAALFSGTGVQFLGADNPNVDRHIEGSFVDAWRRCAGVLPKSWFKSASFKNSPIIPDLANGTGCVVLPTDFYLLNSFKMVGWKKPIYETAVENERTSSIQNNEYTRGSQIRPVGTTKSMDVDVTKIIALNSVNIPDKKTIEPYTYVRIGEKIFQIPQLVIWCSQLEGTGQNNDYEYGNCFTFNGDIWIYIGQSCQSNTFPEASSYWKKIEGKTFSIEQVLSYYSLPKGLASHTIEEALYIPSVKPLSEFDSDEDLGIDQRILEPLAYLSASTVFTIFEKYDIAKALEIRVSEMFPGFKSQVGAMITIKQ